VLGLFGKRRSTRKISTSLSKRRMTEKAKADVEESLDAISTFKKEAAALEKEKAQALEEVNRRWSEVVNEISELTITPLKKDVLVELFGVAWMPFHVIEAGAETFELTGYGKSAG
jgi:predicted nuclease with TOPRIM domain